MPGAASQNRLVTATVVAHSAGNQTNVLYVVNICTVYMALASVPFDAWK
jgi:hypothetical protein